MDVPATLDTPEFRKLWNEWIAFRRTMRWPKYKTDRAILNLSRYPVAAAIKAIEVSMNQGWMSLWPERHVKTDRPGRCPAPSGKYDHLDGEPDAE